MDSISILDYQRDRALDWLRKQFQNPDFNDKDFDALIRKVAGIDKGRLYGFVQLPSSLSSLPPGVAKANRDTKIKRKPIASNYLLEEEQTAVSSGHELKYSFIYRDRHDHYFIELENGKQGYIYGPHWELPEDDRNKEVKLEVPYASQRDNWTKYHGPGGRQCCLTSHCMAADYLMDGFITQQAKVKGYQEAEDFYGEVLYQFGDTTNPQAHTPALQHFGVESYFSYTGSIKDLLLCLDQGVPVPLGVAYKASGHYVCAVGHRSDGVYIHDPFGIRIGMTDNYENTPGDFDFVSWDWLQAKWVDQGSEAGWMRVMTAVNGDPTGAPQKL